MEENRVYKSRTALKEVKDEQEIRREDGTVIVLFFPENNNVPDRNP